MNTYVIFLLRLKRKSRAVEADRTELHKIPEIASRFDVEVLDVVGTTGRIEAVLLCLAKDNETIMQFIDCLEGWYTETFLGTTHFRKG